MTEPEPARDMKTSTPESLPKVFTPEEIAKHFGWSSRKLREKARSIGACRLLGNRMVLTATDVEQLLEATRPAPALEPPLTIIDF